MCIHWLLEEEVGTCTHCSSSMIYELMIYDAFDPPYICPPPDPPCILLRLLLFITVDTAAACRRIMCGSRPLIQRGPPRIQKGDRKCDENE